MSGLEGYGCLPQLGGKASGPLQARTLVDYVWIQPNTQQCTGAPSLKSKTRVVESCTCLEDVPVISEVVGDEAVILRPRKLLADPFRAGGGFIVLCDAFAAPQVSDLSAPLPPLQPHHTNRRVLCADTLKRAAGSRPVFAAEQEYVLLPGADGACTSGGGAAAALGSSPLGGHGSLQSSHETCTFQQAGSWPHAHLPDPTRPYFIPMHGPALPVAPATVSTATGRQFAEQLLQACLQAGIQLTEVSQGTAPNTWAFKLAPMDGLSLADELWVARHVASRLADQRGLLVSFDGSASSGAGAGGGIGCHFKYSTEETRQPLYGLSQIQQHVARLEARHPHHLIAYTNGNVHKTPGGLDFSCALATSGLHPASVVVPSSTLLARAGHYVDRRPPSDVDPYVVTMALVSTTLGVPLPAILEPPPRPCPSGRAPAAPTGGSGWCASPANSGGTMCTEDVLIDELRKLDHPTDANSQGSSQLEEGMDECSDDAISPPSSVDVGGLLSATCAEEVGAACCGLQKGQLQHACH